MRCPQLGTPHEVSTFFDTVLGDRLKILRALNRYISVLFRYFVRPKNKCGLIQKGHTTEKEIGRQAQKDLPALVQWVK